MRTQTRLKGILLATSAVAAFAQVAQAQPAAAIGPAVDEVVVTGLRASNQRAVNIKRSSDQIIDTVSATEIGALPDFNAGDALKRVTGVNALLYQGEPRFVIVRGFSQNYNDLTIDGFSLASTDINLGQTNVGGRQISMEVLPSNIASHIDVVKSATPATEGGFIGGLTNFVTPGAFDFKKNSLSASIVGGEALDSHQNGGDHFTGQAEISGATRFGDHDQFGVYISATSWQRQINVPQVETGGARNWYTAAGTLTTPYGGTGYAVPSQRLDYNYQNKRDRSGLQARFDWRPSADLSAFLEAYYYNQNERSYRNDFNAAVQTASLDLNQTPTSGLLTNVTQQVQLGRYRWHRNVSGLLGRFDRRLGEGWKLDGGASWSNSEVKNPQTVDNFAQAKMAFTYDTSGEVPSFTAVNAAAAANPALYALGFHREELFHLGENRYDGQLNLGRNTEAQDRGFGVAVGGRINATTQRNFFSRINYTGAPYTLANVVASNTLCGFVCDTPEILVDPNKATSLWRQYLSASKATPDLASDAGGTYAVNEQVYAGYVQAQYRTDRGFVVGGVRVEHTRFGSDSTQATNGVYSSVSASTDYTNVLPSVLAVITTSTISKLRLGVSETLGRPTFGAEALHGGVSNTTTSPATLAVGNPNLKPRRAENFDLGHDWYINGGHGIVSIAGFYKLIHDDIFTYGALQKVDGVTGQVLVTQARNTNDTVRAWGGEIGFSEDFTFLPAPFDGLGVFANATLSRAHFPVTLSDGAIRTFHNLPEQPDQIFNASIDYDKGKVHGRLAWNHLGRLWDDRFPNFTPTGFYANRFQQPTDNFDLQASYDVTPHLSVRFEGLNLSAQGMTYKYGQNQELLQSKWALPTQVMIGVTFRP